MLDFINAVLEFDFIQNAILAGILASIVCGITGTFVVVKRISYIAGGIAHSVLGGVGIAYYLGINPLWGAFVFAIGSALLIGIIKLKSNQHVDTVISALWSIGMATGIIFMSLKPGYNADLLMYLFGNILLVTKSNLVLLLILNLFIFLIVFVYYRQLIAISFDSVYAKIRRLHVDFLYLLLLVLIALTIVILLQIVGLILLIALLTLPAAISGLFNRSPGLMMISAALLGILFTLAGIFVSYNWDLPSGASIIVISGTTYLVVLYVKKIAKSLKKKK